MASTNIFVVLILSQLLAAKISAGDSGSEEERRQAFCKELRSTGPGHVPTLAYPANVAVLMDSWNYQNLLPPRTGAVWQQVDNDTNNMPLGLTTNWIQNSNSPCQQNVHVCGYSAGRQNNWLITQLINRTVEGERLPQVSILIEFEMQGCDVTLNCQRTFNTHVYETSLPDSDEARNIKNYRQVERISPDNTSGAKVNETIDVNFSTEFSSFYFAIQDETSCIVITRMIIFYHVCPSKTADLVQRPQTVAPIVTRQSLPISVEAQCVENASPINMLDGAPTVKCNEGGLWSSVPSLGCQCDLGYLASEDRRRCEACPDGQYFSSYLGACADCPANSTSMSLNATNGSLLIDSCVCSQGDFQPRGPRTNGSCDTVIIPTEKPNNSMTSSLTIIIPTVFVLTAITVVIVSVLYLYKLYRKRSRMYQINGFAPWQNGSDVINNTGRQDSGPQIYLHQNSTDVQSRPTSTKMNVTSFLLKIFGSPSTLDDQQLPDENGSVEREDRNASQLEKVLYYNLEEENLFHGNGVGDEDDEKKLDDFDKRGYLSSQV